MKAAIVYVLALIVGRLNFIGDFRALGSTKQRRDTLFALAFGHLLVQSTFIPITLTIPSVADYFGVDVDEAAWSVIIRLLVLGSTVFLAARLGEKYGHIQVFFTGLAVMTIANLVAATSQNLTQLIIWSGCGGFGAAMVTANGNAMLAMMFEPNERGRAFAVPVTASRIGTLMGVALYGAFLALFNWRVVFGFAVLTGALALWFSFPLLKYRFLQALEDRRKININYSSAVLLVVTLAVFVLSGSHLHDGAESYTSPDALRYHLPMHLLTLALLGLFLVIQARSREPFLDFRYFKRANFSMALFSNTTFHLSMLTVFTLVPILVEDGLGYSPFVVSMVLLCHQSFGLWLPPIAGLIYDRYNPRWLGPGVAGYGGGWDWRHCSVRGPRSDMGAAHAAAARVGRDGIVHLALQCTGYEHAAGEPEFCLGDVGNHPADGAHGWHDAGRDGAGNQPAGHRGVDAAGRRAALLSARIPGSRHDRGLDSSGGGNSRGVPADAIGYTPGAGRGARPSTQRGRLEAGSSSRLSTNGGLRLYYPRSLSCLRGSRAVFVAYSHHYHRSGNPEPFLPVQPGLMRVPGIVPSAASTSPPAVSWLA